MQLQDSHRTVCTLGNGAELVAAIVLGVVGNDVADTINGSPLTRSTIFNLAQLKFQEAVGKYLGGE
ncbi:hypothetical protein [Burkholderia phage FLC9]|nr:hypothetical protein [Burkholderia phage FLC9]